MSYLEGPKTFDPVRPGEQWFCYWKTSASLWESRLLSFPAHEVIFIPLFWGFHAEGPATWDFGRLHPERDLLRLTQVLTQHRRKFCWLLPLTPAPFLPNGGVPVSCARTLSVSGQGVHLAALDQEGTLNKMYSFFEPKVFSAFSEFLQSFGSFLAEHQIKAPVWGASFKYLEAGISESYLTDHSLAFEQGFSRYLKKNHKGQEGVDLMDPLIEENLKRDFTQEVEKLFATIAQESLTPFWSGIQVISLLGGSPRETILRSLPVGKSQLEYLTDIFNHYSHDRWISSVLLRKEERTELLVKLLEEHFGYQEIERRYLYLIQGGDLTEEWMNFGLVDIFDNGKSEFRETGLISFLEKNYQWLYTILPELNFTTDTIEANQHKIKFFHGKDMDRLHFSQMLKLFMMGQRIVFDRTGLNPELDKRLQVFFLENNLKLQTVNFLTHVTLCELGDGAFISYEGEKLKLNQGHEFWNNIFRFFKITHPEVKADSEVFSLWRIRATTPHELSYLDVRRVNFYNPTSYKKQVIIHTNNRFAFMKMIDPHKASAKSVTHGVEVELLPNGRIALDFGHYEEK